MITVKNAHLFFYVLFNDTLNSYSYMAPVIDEWLWNVGEMMSEAIRSTLKETRPSTIFSTTNLIWTDLESKLGLRTRNFMVNKDTNSWKRH
jgi:hypothetical protein